MEWYIEAIFLPPKIVKEKEIVYLLIHLHNSTTHTTQNPSLYKLQINITSGNTFMSEHLIDVEKNATFSTASLAVH